MDTQRFWEIVEASHDKNMETNETKLYWRLVALSEDELIAFVRIWDDCFWRLYDHSVWGVAYLLSGGCSDDSFMDWRNWIIACGRRAFETAMREPDELLSLADSEPDAGEQGVSGAIINALKKKNIRWVDIARAEGGQHPTEPSGTRWQTEEDLKPLLPKAYERYTEKMAKLMRPWWKFWA